MRLAIIGMGPYGLCVLETVLRYLRDCVRDGTSLESVTIHVIEPHEAGPGVHQTDLPDYLLLNTVAGQLDLFGSREFGGTQPATPFSFLEWLDREAYSIDDDSRVIVSRSGRKISPDDFLPRRVFGRYLAWVYTHLTQSFPTGTRIVRHLSEAISIRQSDGGEEVAIANGERLCVNHVFLATGHTSNTRENDAIDYHMPYPVTDAVASIPPQSDVAIAGCGLVATDVITALTVGRGGDFVAKSEGWSRTYRPSGREPRISIYSRNGLPLLCRPVASRDLTGAYRPLIFTPDTIRQRRTRAGGRLDFQLDVLPLLFAEMTIHYYTQHTRLSGSRPDATRSCLAEAWRTGSFSSALTPFVQAFGPFEPEGLLFGDIAAGAETSRGSQDTFADLVRRDVEESLKGESFSSFKATGELFRVLRDTIRYAVEGDSLTPSSKRAFSTTIASLINRIVVGPPVQRGIELLALLEAGVVSVPFGPSPSVVLDPTSRRYRISSTRLVQPFSREVDAIIAGRLDAPTIDRSRSALLSQLYAEGRVRAFQDVETGAGIDVDRECRPIDAEGRPAQRLSVLGPLTEGCRYFTYYVPSPKSRFAAFLEADRAVSAALSAHLGALQPQLTTVGGAR